MKKLIVAIAFVLVPAFVADAASAQHHRHVQPAQKSRVGEPAPAPSAPPVTRLPIAPDTFRA